MFLHWRRTLKCDPKKFPTELKTTKIDFFWTAFSRSMTASVRDRHLARNFINQIWPFCSCCNRPGGCTSIVGVFRDTRKKTVLFAFGIIYLFWPSDDAHVHYINRSALLIYSYYVLEASSQSFAVKRYGANKCVC